MAPSAPWTYRIEELVEFVERHMINRRDVWGEATTNGRVTCPPIRQRGSVHLTPQIVREHFGGKRVIGLHSTSSENTCRWLAVDIDQHGNVDSVANEQAAISLWSRLRELGFNALLWDSNGDGGYHVVVIFDAPVPSRDAHAFLVRLVADWRALGLACAPENFPKQPALSDKRRCGNWLRLFGRHHSRDHWSRLWNGQKWLEGADAIDEFLAHPLTDHRLLPSVPATIQQIAASTVPSPPAAPESIVQRARAYLSSVPNVGDGQGRNNSAFRAACFLIRDLGLDEAVAMAELAVWNSRNTPPLDAGEMQQIVMNAAQYAQHAPGAALCRQSKREAAYQGVIAKLNSKQAEKAPPTESLAADPVDQFLSKWAIGAKDSYDILYKYLLYRDPQYRIADKIHFASENIDLTPAQCSGLRGALELVRRLPEYEEQKDKDGKVKTTSHYSLTEKMFGVVGRRLLTTLPVGSAEGSQEVDEIRTAIIAFLIQPRTITSTVAVQRSYAIWATLLEQQGTGWRQCGTHAVFAHRNAAHIEIGILPDYLVHQCSLLKRRFGSSVRAGKALLDAGLITRANDGKGSHVIRIESRRVRVWMLAPDIIAAACGEAVVTESAEDRLQREASNESR